MIAFDVRHYDSIGSTNDEAMRLAREGAVHGTVVHADEQTAGRGRLSRRWLSPPGNLYLSIVLRPDVPAARSAEIGLVAALAVADAVDALLPQQVRATLKWPNDVLVRDGKIAGILLEQADDTLIARHWTECPPGAEWRFVPGINNRWLRRIGHRRWRTGKTSVCAGQLVRCMAAGRLPADPYELACTCASDRRHAARAACGPICYRRVRWHR